MTTKTTRTLKIDNKIFSKTDVSRLAQIVYSESQNLTTSKTKQFTLEIQCVDNTKHETDDLSLLNDVDVIDRRRAELIWISLYSLAPERRIRVYVRHSKISSSNVVVSGDDPKWVNGIYRGMEDCVQSIEPQNDWVKRWNVLIIFLVAFVGIYAAITLNQWLDFKVTSPVYWLNIVSLTSFFSILLTSIISRLEDSWPAIEFAFGPEHLRIEARRRRWIGALITIIVLPLIPSIIYDLSKSFFLH